MALLVNPTYMKQACYIKDNSKFFSENFKPFYAMNKEINVYLCSYGLGISVINLFLQE